METEEIDIIGAWKKGDLFCTYKYRYEIGKDAFDKGKIDSQRPMHEDLRKAFADLEVHMPVILQELNPDVVPGINNDILQQRLTDNDAAMVGLFSCTGIEIDLEDNSVSLIGTKKLNLGTMPFATPFVRFEGTYALKMELRILADRLIQEVKLYIDGKQAPTYVTADMFAPAGDGDEPPVIEEKKRRGRPKKLVDAMANKLLPGSSEHDEALAKANAGDEETEPITSFFNPGNIEL